MRTRRKANVPSGRRAACPATGNGKELVRFIALINSGSVNKRT
jgi:hypothetical protein